MAARLALTEAAGHRPGPLALVPEILPIESMDYCSQTRTRPCEMSPLPPAGAHGKIRHLAHCPRGGRPSGNDGLPGSGTALLLNIDRRGRKATRSLRVSHFKQTKISQPRHTFPDTGFRTVRARLWSTAETRRQQHD